MLGLGSGCGSRLDVRSEARSSRTRDHLMEEGVGDVGEAWKGIMCSAAVLLLGCSGPCVRFIMRIMRAVPVMGAAGGWLDGDRAMGMSPAPVSLALSGGGRPSVGSVLVESVLRVRGRPADDGHGVVLVEQFPLSPGVSDGGASNPVVPSVIPSSRPPRSAPSP